VWVVERPRTLKLPPYPTGEANITSIHEENILVSHLFWMLANLVTLICQHQHWSSRI
jgi:hypothetical protein